MPEEKEKQVSRPTAQAAACGETAEIIAQAPSELGQQSAIRACQAKRPAAKQKAGAIKSAAKDKGNAGAETATGELSASET